MQMQFPRLHIQACGEGPEDDRRQAIGMTARAAAPHWVYLEISVPAARLSGQDAGHDHPAHEVVGGWRRQGPVRLNGTEDASEARRPGSGIRAECVSLSTE